MKLRALVSALAALLIAGIFAVGLAAGNAWGRGISAAAAQNEQRDQLRALNEDLVALQHKLERHAEAQHQLAERALDCRAAAMDRHGGKRVALAMARVVR